ncbi:MAG TPA: TIGR03557 family F420-dependent LLM class oxidoreductase [Actinomycetota bacterium]|nr:TIGR03557 family F420-dependent LLM class oxidoreductase [Actinomycetota bacterium]
MKFGLKLCAEERSATELVDDAVRAEEAGFDFAALSDHFHPWIDEQGESPFAWTVLGGIATATERIEVGTGVTCPTIRIHPAIVAQAAATVATMMPGRSFIGLGTGENLNEHVTGERWPRPDVRRDMLREAVAAMRALWSGEMVTMRGEHYVVESARLYSVPEDPPPVLVSASGSESVSLAAEIGDGLIGTAPDADLLSTYRAEGGGGRIAYGEITVCWNEDPDEAMDTVMRCWPNLALAGSLNTELALPKHFEDATRLVREDDLRPSVVLGPELGDYLGSVEAFDRAGYDGVWFHQVGEDQEGFTAFAERELLPALRAS